MTSEKIEPLAAQKSSMTVDTGSSAGVRRRRRFVPRSKVGRLISGAAFLCLLAGGLWYNQHRSMSWSQTLNPFYWVGRFRGDDLYLVDKAMLQHGNRSLPEVALTFDDGPHTESRAQILDTLKKYGIHATFFDVGMRMALSPDLVRRTLAEGHEEANHSSTHQRLDVLTDKERHREINEADITYCRITGKHLAYLRPPGMRYNDIVLHDTREAGYIVVGYTTASRDFDPTESAAFIVDRTCERTENGSIILLHDYAATAGALPAILERLQKSGFRFVTISEMIDHLPAHPHAAAEKFLFAQDPTGLADPPPHP